MCQEAENQGRLLDNKDTLVHRFDITRWLLIKRIEMPHHQHLPFYQCRFVYVS